MLEGRGLGDWIKEDECLAKVFAYPMDKDDNVVRVGEIVWQRGRIRKAELYGTRQC